MRTKIVCERNRGNKNVRIHMDNLLKSHVSSISNSDTNRKWSANFTSAIPKLFRLVFFSLFFFASRSFFVSGFFLELFPIPN